MAVPDAAPLIEQGAGSSAANGWRRYVNSKIAAELSALARYYDAVINWLPRPEDEGILFQHIEAKQKLTVATEADFPD